MKIKLFKIKNNTINSIEDQLNELTKEYYRKFCNNTLDIIQEQIKGIPEYKIEDWIQEELTNEIKKTISKKVNKLNESLEEIIIRINNKENSIKILNTLIDDNYELNQLLKPLSLELDLDEIIEQFKYKIRNKLSYYCEPFNSVSSRNLESIIADISYDIVRKIRNTKENFQEEYNQIIKTEIKNSLIKMRNKIKEQEQEQNLTNEKIQILSENLKYSGFTLIQENGRLYVEEIKDLNNNQHNYKVEIRYFPDTETLKSIDNRLIFSVKNNAYLSMDSKTNTKFLIDKDRITLFDTVSMSIIKDKNNYLFYYNNQKIANPLGINTIIREFEKKTPQYYNELLKDPNFKMIERDGKKYKKKLFEEAKENIEKRKQQKNIPQKTDNMTPQVTKPTIKIPIFYELEFLATTYEIFYDKKNQIKIRNINTGIVQTEQTIITKAIFANIWLSAAGIKRTPGDIRFGETFAFSPSSKELYNVVCKKLLESIQNKGFIDTVELFKFICDNNIFEHGEQIITNLFNTENLTKEIDNLFLQALGISSSTKPPIVLSSIDHAYNLAYPEARESAKNLKN